MATDTFLDDVVKLKFLLPLARYLFSVVSDNRYLFRGCFGHVLSIIVTGNVSVIREKIPVLTIPFLDFSQCTELREFGETLLEETLLLLSSVIVKDNSRSND